MLFTSILSSHISTMLATIKLFINTFHKELFVTFTISTLIYIICRIILNKSTTKSTPSSIILQSKTNLTKFKIKCNKLACDNSVYLTIFKQDGIVALLFHAIYELFAYFTDLINLSCLIISFFQIYEYHDFRTLLPLSIFATYHVLNHLYSISTLLKEQQSINYKKITRLHYKKKEFIEEIIYQHKLKRGDFIDLRDGDYIPADILLINCSNILTQELELTGEDIVLSKNGINIDFNKSNAITINHRSNSGYISIENNIYNYSSKNMLFRGTKIVDIPDKAFGIVIESGNDCQMFCIDNKIQTQKTHIQKKIINICITNLYILLLIASLCAIIIYSKSITYEYSYKRLWSIIRKMILLFNTMIPFSLLLFFNTSSKIISNRIAKQNNVIINRNGITSFQFNPQYIVSDKTGTITTGKLSLSHMYVAVKDNFVNIVNPKVSGVNNKILLRILACSEIQTHSKTHLLLKSDIIEETILSYLLNRFNDKLITNNQIIETQNLGKYERLYYKPYDYHLEVKIGVVKRDDIIVLHIQGTPEAVNKYSNYRMTSILNKIDGESPPNNAYQRIIAHAAKSITCEELEYLKIEPLKILNNMVDATVYVFNDWLVPDVDKSINELFTINKDFTLLTGDKCSSAIEVGKCIKIAHDVKIIDTIDDFNNLDITYKNICHVINGRLLEELISENKIYKFTQIINSSNRRIIYRASPNDKQLFVSLLRKKNEVCMVGDGTNDVSAIMKSNVGICIKKSDNNNVQHIAEIIVDDWTIIPQLLKDFTQYQTIISNISQWVILKHMISAFVLLAMLLITNFEKIRDPASPFLMSVFNSSMFMCMCAYSQYAIPNTTIIKTTFNHMIIYGMILGIINGCIIFTLNDINSGIHISICVEALQLILQLYWFAYGKATNNKLKLILMFNVVFWIVKTMWF